MARDQTPELKAENFTVYAPHYEAVRLGVPISTGQRLFQDDDQFYNFTAKYGDVIQYFGAHANFALIPGLVAQISITSRMNVSVPFFMTDMQALYGQSDRALPVLRFAEPVVLNPGEQLQIFSLNRSGIGNYSRAVLTFVGVRNVVLKVDPRESSRPTDIFSQMYADR